ncbi:MAG TPA: NAD-dependent epimerase/dehydratase family protein [Candidatus Dormibacteraeota bacterium]|nr:NAD-dependent epimerase/dehydratase family protein [Candidatus Dormibacteraeota bacterium]
MSARSGRVVILGASGFLGRALHSVLMRDGVEVIGYSSRTLDLTRPEAFAALDTVLTPKTALVFASALTPDRGQTPATFLANTTMATNLAAYLEGRRRLGSLIYLGSDAVYGFGDEAVTEDTPVAPAGYYALGKYAAERVMDCAARAASVPLLALRVTGVYGPGDPHASYGPNAFARSLVRDRSVRIFGAGEEERDHIFVDDVAAIAAGLLRTGATGVYNVATGQSRSFADVVKTIRDLVSYDLEVTSVARKGAITHRRFDVGRLTAALPGLRLTPLREGLIATLAAFGALRHG